MPPGATEMIYAARVGAWTQLQLERLFGRIPRNELARRHAWLNAARATVDPVWTRDDGVPGIADLLWWLWNVARHPRAFLRHNTRKPL